MVEPKVGDKIPRPIIVLLVVFNALFALMPLKQGMNSTSLLAVAQQAAVQFALLPAVVVTLAWIARRMGNEIKLLHAYYFGLFVAFGYTLQLMKQH